MAPVTLEASYRRLVTQLGTLGVYFTNATDPRSIWPNSIAREMIAEMVVLSAHDIWARFCRSLIVASAGYRPRDSTGARLPYAPGVHHPRDVIPTLLRTYRRKRFEPRWGDATQAIDAAQRLAIPNLTNVSSALGSSSSPADDLRVLRNFFAHRAKDTAILVRGRTWCPHNARLTALALAAQPSPGGILLYERWIIELQAIAYAASR